MIICSKCGHRSGVLETREYGLTVYRRRECRSCKFRWTTWEHTTPPNFNQYGGGEDSEMKCPACKKKGGKIYVDVNYKLPRVSCRHCHYEASLDNFRRNAKREDFEAPSVSR